MKTKEYKLLPAQREFMEVLHSCKLDVAVYQGGFGSGKTFSGSLLGVLLCEKHPGIKGLVGARTFPLVRDTTLVNYFQHLDYLGYKRGIHYEYIKSEAKLTFDNKSEILFRYFDDDTKLKSLNLGFVEIEEMSDIPEATFKMLLGRLRQPEIPRYRLFGHTNPEANKGWIYKTFVENPRSNYRLIIAPTTENYFLTEGYVENLKAAYDPEYYRINVLGEFGDYSRGLATKGFTHRNLKSVTYQKDKPLHICCDFNVDPMCWLLAHKDDNKVYFFDEIVVENTSTLEVVKEFCSRYPDHKGEIIINGDASGDFRSTTSEYTNYALIHNNLKAFGYKKVSIKIKLYNPPVKHRIAAWNAKIKSADNEIGIYIDNKCKWLLYNVYNLKYRPGSTVLDLPTQHQIKSDRERKFLSHPFDAASYLVDYYWPIKLER